MDTLDLSQPLGCFVFIDLLVASNWSPEQVASLFGFLGLGFSLFSMAMKSNDALLRINFFAAIWWGLNGFFLGSITSLGVQLVGAALTAVRIFCPERFHSDATKISLGLVCLAAAATWQGVASLPVTIATLCLIAGIGLAKGVWVRVLFLAANSFFFAHAIIFNSFEQIIACTACYVAIAIGLIRMRSAKSA